MLLLSGEILSTFWTSDTLPGILLLKLNSQRPANGERLMMADERVLFWQKKLAENQQVLEVINAGQLKSSDGSVLDETTLAEVRKWAMRRVMECEARIAERAKTGGGA